MFQDPGLTPFQTESAPVRAPCLGFRYIEGSMADVIALARGFRQVGLQEQTIHNQLEVLWLRVRAESAVAWTAAGR